MTEYERNSADFITTDYYEDRHGNRVYGPVMDGVRYMPCGDTVQLVKNVAQYPVDTDDIILLTYPKSGTIWVSNIMNMIMHKKELQEDPTQTSFKLPGLFFIEGFLPIFPPGYDTRDAPTRLSASHAFPYLLPTDVHQGNGRVVYVTRNPKDTIVSFYHYFVKSHSDFKGTFENFFDIFMEGEFHYGDWFEHTIACHEFVQLHKDQCLIVSYEKLHIEPMKQIQRIADHIGYTITDDDTDMILRLTGVDEMRKRMEEVETSDVKTKDWFRSHCRKGKVGDWRNHFTVAMNDRFDVEYEKRLRGTGISHAFDIDK